MTDFQGHEEGFRFRMAARSIGAFGYLQSAVRSRGMAAPSGVGEVGA